MFSILQRVDVTQLNNVVFFCTGPGETCRTLILGNLLITPNQYWCRYQGHKPWLQQNLELTEMPKDSVSGA